MDFYGDAGLAWHGPFGRKDDAASIGLAYAQTGAAGRDLGAEGRGPVVVIAFSPDDMGRYFELAGDLRRAGAATLSLHRQ